MNPDPTWTYFWPTVNKGPVWLLPGYFLTRIDEILFDPNVVKLMNLGFLGEIISRPKDGWPDPGLKFFTRTHHNTKSWELFYKKSVGMQITIFLTECALLIVLTSGTEKLLARPGIETTILYLSSRCQVLLTTWPRWPLKHFLSNKFRMTKWLMCLMMRLILKIISVFIKRKLYPKNFFGDTKSDTKDPRKFLLSVNQVLLLFVGKVFIVYFVNPCQLQKLNDHPTFLPLLKDLAKNTCHIVISLKQNILLLLQEIVFFRLKFHVRHYQ